MFPFKETKYPKNIQSHWPQVRVTRNRKHNHKQQVIKHENNFTSWSRQNRSPESSRTKNECRTFVYICGGVNNGAKQELRVVCSISPCLLHMFSFLFKHISCRNGCPSISSFTHAQVTELFFFQLFVPAVYDILLACFKMNCHLMVIMTFQVLCAIMAVQKVHRVDIRQNICLRMINRPHNQNGFGLFHLIYIQFQSCL